MHRQNHGLLRLVTHCTAVNILASVAVVWQASGVQSGSEARRGFGQMRAPPPPGRRLNSDSPTRPAPIFSYTDGPHSGPCSLTLSAAHGRGSGSDSCTPSPSAAHRRGSGLGSGSLTRRHPPAAHGRGSGSLILSLSAAHGRGSVSGSLAPSPFRSGGRFWLTCSSFEKRAGYACDHAALCEESLVHPVGACAAPATI